MGRMDVRLNGEPLEEVDILSTWGCKWQLLEDVKGMWGHKMNEKYKLFEKLKTVRPFIGLKINAIGVCTKK